MPFQIMGNCPHRAARTGLHHAAKHFGRGRGHSPLSLLTGIPQIAVQRAPGCITLQSISEEGAGTARYFLLYRYSILLILSRSS